MLGLLVAVSCVSARARDLDVDTPWTPPDYFAPEQYADVNGIRLCYLEAGTEHERAIVFVHGWSGNVHNWWDQFEYFSRRYHVLVFDLPGHGKSEKGEHLKYDMEEWVSAVESMMEARSISSAVVVGNSAGGNIAARFALEHPERVELLVLADSTGSGRDGVIKVVKPVINPKKLERAGLTTGEHFPGEDSKSRARAEMIRSYVGTREEGPYLDGLARSFAASYERISNEELAQIEMPTLLLWGRDDPVVPKRALRIFQKHVPDNRTYWISGAGHNPNTETPEVFNCAVEAFIGGRTIRGCQPDEND